jgi:hypothetical protein
MPSRARFSAEAPYNALPQLPPKAELETKPVMKALVGARAALAELKQAGELIPNQSILINTLPVLEGAPARRSRTSSLPPTDCSDLRSTTRASRPIRPPRKRCVISPP